MFFGDTPVDKDNQNGGRVDILLVFIVVLKLTTHLFRTLWVVRFKWRLYLRVRFFGTLNRMKP